MSAANPSSERSRAIDAYRGLAIVLMVPANYLADVVWVPRWLKHAPDIGFTVIDLIAPMFLFAVGLTYVISFQSRLRREPPGAVYRHFITRWAALIGFGSIYAAGEIAAGSEAGSWGVLQAIGASGLFSLFFINKATWVRALVGVLVLLGYQFLLDQFWLDIILHSSHGGLPAVLSWASMLLLSTALADLYHASPSKTRYMMASFIVLLVGIAAIFVTPLSKNRVSSSYILLTLGMSAVLFGALHALVERSQLRLAHLCAWGKNPLILYLLHEMFIGVFVLPGIPNWHAEAPPWLVLLQLLSLYLSLGWIARTLERKQFFFSL